jgi:stage II sporulation protein P
MPSFNSNPRYNVVRVGEELARHLRKYGIETLHNGTVHDKVRDAAYSVSIETLNSYKKSYPSIQVYIDVHRDAARSDKPKLRLTKEINGKKCAQIMFVVAAEGTLPHPKWQENLSFVLKLQQKLNEKYPGLARPVWIVEARYNQHISTQSILVEVGGDGNLLSECLESTKYLAEVLNEVLEECS